MERSCIGPKRAARAPTSLIPLSLGTLRHPRGANRRHDRIGNSSVRGAELYRRVPAEDQFLWAIRRYYRIIEQKTIDQVSHDEFPRPGIYRIPAEQGNSTWGETKREPVATSAGSTPGSYIHYCTRVALRTSRLPMELSVSLMIPDWLPYLLNGLLFLTIASVVYYGIRLGITPMPSSRKAIATFIALIPYKANGKIVDLDPDGVRLPTPSPSDFRRRGDRLRAFAYPVAVLAAERRLRPTPTSLYTAKRLRRRPQRCGCGGCLPSSAAMRKLRPKFERELRPGTLVLSNTFVVPTWKPTQTLHLGKSWLSTSNDIHVYHV